MSYQLDSLQRHLAEANRKLNGLKLSIKKLDEFSTLLIDMNCNGLLNVKSIEVAQKLESILQDFEEMMGENE